MGLSLAAMRKTASDLVLTLLNLRTGLLDSLHL